MNEITLDPNVNSAWVTFKRLLLSVIDKHVPFIEKTVRGRYCPWLTSEIKLMMKEADNILQRARKTISEQDWSGYRRLRNQVTTKIRQSKASHTRSMLRENIKNSKQFWKQIKKAFPVKGRNTCENKVLDINGQQTSESHKIANGFCKFFTNISEQLLSGVNPFRNRVWRYYNQSILGNYTPISVLPVVSKVLEQIVHKQIYGYLEEFNLISSKQFGFRKDYLPSML